MNDKGKVISPKSVRVSPIEETMANIRKHDCDTQDIIESCVARLCNVDVQDMLSSTRKLIHSQARWLLWYAYRLSLNETYEQIAESMSSCGRKFTKAGVRHGVNQMSYLVDKDVVWRKRWMTVKSLIHQHIEQNCRDEDCDIVLPQKIKMSLLVPTGWRQKIEVEIKETK